jgi:hypothetical protein
MMKNKFINETIYALCLILFFLSVSFYYADLFNLDRHWTSKYDQELPIAYNALLFNSSIIQEYTDHSAYFTILSSSFYLKLLNFFGFIDIYKFSQVVGNVHNLTATIEVVGLNEIFQDVIFHLRCLSVGVNALVAVAITYLFNIIFKRKVFSFILAVIVFYLYGNLNNLTTIRSETFSVLFLILSLIALKIFFEKKKIIYFVFFFSLLFFSILEKSQVIFYIPAILLFTFYINEKKIFYNFSFLENINKNKIIFQIILFLILLITFKSLIFGRDFKTWLFLIFLITIINIYFYKISDDLTLKNNLIIFNISLIAGYTFFNIIVFLHPSSTPSILHKTIFEVVKHSIIYKSELVSSSSFIDFLLTLIDLSVSNTFVILNFFFTTLNSYLIIFIASIIGLIFSLNKYSIREKKLFFATFLAFIFISQINFMRGDIVNRYLVYSDYLVVLILGVMLNRYGKKISLILATLSLVLIFLINQKYIEASMNRLTFDQTYELCKTIEKEGYTEGSVYYFNPYANRIPMNIIKDFCTNN